MKALAKYSIRTHKGNWWLTGDGDFSQNKHNAASYTFREDAKFVLEYYVRYMQVGKLHIVKDNS